MITNLVITTILFCLPVETRGSVEENYSRALVAEATWRECLSRYGERSRRCGYYDENVMTPDQVGAAYLREARWNKSALADYERMLDYYLKRVEHDDGPTDTRLGFPNFGFVTLGHFISGAQYWRSTGESTEVLKPLARRIYHELHDLVISQGFDPLVRYDLAWEKEKVKKPPFPDQCLFDPWTLYALYELAKFMDDEALTARWGAHLGDYFAVNHACEGEYEERDFEAAMAIYREIGDVMHEAEVRDLLAKD